MPAFLEMGPETMSEYPRADGLVVPLSGYVIYLQGASPSGLSPSDWLTVKKFWEMYFAEPGARLGYSADCNANREDLR
jgi:hypothetical protein